MSTAFEKDLVEAFGSERVGRRAPLASYTTFRVGGPADWLVETRTSDEILLLLRIAARHGVSVTMLGGGSNVLVGDGGIRGLVIRPRGGAVGWVDDHHIRADAAMTVNGLVRWMVLQGAAGLESWAGTPGTVGGAIFGNAHFNGQQIGDHVTGVRLAGRDGQPLDVPASEMGFAYDRSRLQDTGEVLLDATFAVGRGVPSALRSTARASLAFRKRTQPLDTPSAGCVFQNPTRDRDRMPEGIPWSAGALVDCARLKGHTIGGASVSPIHGNFIVNLGTATAADIRRLIQVCRAEVRERFGVDLREEIVYLGTFTD